MEYFNSFMQKDDDGKQSCREFLGKKNLFLHAWYE